MKCICILRVINVTVAHQPLKTIFIREGEADVYGSSTNYVELDGGGE